MKRFFMNLRVLAVVAMACVLVFSCKETTGGDNYVGDFDLRVKTVGPDYIDVTVYAPHEVSIAYKVAYEPEVTTPVVLFKEGSGSHVVSVRPGQELRITDGLIQDTEHYIYAAAKLDDRNYSKIVELQFTTEPYNFDKLITVVDTYLDGFKFHITVPKETKERGNVIRYGSTSLAWYNLMKEAKGGEGVDLNAVAANGDPYANFVKNDSTIVYDDSNIVLLDEDGNPVLDESNQMMDIHDPIAPGEPTIIIAGECRWGSPDEYAEIMGFHLPESHSYSIPLYDVDKREWFGAFDKVEFVTKEPTLCDATLEIDIPEDEITVTDAMVYFDMSDDAACYFYMILDDSTYKQMMKSYLSDDEDGFQWFVTSYIAFYEWGVVPETEDTYVNAAAKFVEPLKGGNTYHVIATVFGDEEGASQRFVHKTFKAKEKTKRAPVIEVAAVPSNDPYVASFNVKAPNKDLAGSYWACNYSREFELMFNIGYTYADLLKGNYSFTSAELAAINSDEGLILSFPTLDGEVTRFAAYGCNDEYTFNQIDPAEEGKGWADYHAPMAEKKTPVASSLFEELAGDWTATATIVAKEQAEDGSIVSYNKKHSSKITISNTAPVLPETLDSYVYDLYAGKSKDEVDGMFEELVDLSNQFTEYRLEGQNRLLCTGFIDFDYYTDPGRMTYRSPYDLFVATNYSSVDVPMLMYDFGPKWFLEVLEDGRVIVPFNSTYLPPMLNWTGYPFYVGGVGTGMAFFDSTAEYPGFPVEISEDRNKITIKPITLGKDNYYMNALGMNGSSTDLEIIATIISEITMTRGWTEPATTAMTFAAAPTKVKPVTMDGQPVTELPDARVYKSMSDFSNMAERPVYKFDENPNVITEEMLKATTEKLLNQFNIK